MKSHRAHPWRLHRWVVGWLPYEGRKLPVWRCDREGCPYWKAPWA